MHLQFFTVHGTHPNNSTSQVIQKMMDFISYFNTLNLIIAIQLLFFLRWLFQPFVLCRVYKFLFYPNYGTLSWLVINPLQRIAFLQTVYH